MADEYVVYPLFRDPFALAQDAFDYIEAAFPGWRPSPGTLAAIQTEAFSQMASEILAVATNVPTSVFRYFGAALADLPPVEQSFAEAQSTWTAVDTLGYTIPEGTLVGVRATGSDIFGFRVDQDYVIAPGASATAAGEVRLVAVAPGSASSGIAETSDVELIDQLVFVSSVELVNPTVGGVDAEPDSDYLMRLSRELELSSPAPILPEDFAILARRVPGVERATAIDGYDPVAETFNNERMVTISAIDENGVSVSAGTFTAIETLLEGMREVNFEVHTTSPLYTLVPVNYEAVAYTGFDVDDVKTRIDTAILDFLSPANWGRPTIGDGSAPIWINEPIVRHNKMMAAIHRVEGVNYVPLLEINSLESDLTMLSVVSLPQAGTITGVVT